MPEELTDDSLMPFGKHKGERMGDVPAKYLIWLWDGETNDDPIGSDTPVGKYIKNNLAQLARMLPNTIIVRKN